MADNYAVDTAPEWGLSVPEEYASTESPMEQSPELLGMSVTEPLSLASNVIPPINLGKVQLPNNSSEIASSEQLKPDRAITPESSINTSSSGESSSPIAPSSSPSTTIQKITSQDTVNVNPTSLETIEPLENSSEIASSEQLKPDRASVPESSIKTSSSGELSSPIAHLIAPAAALQKLSSQDTVNVNPTSLETIQPLDKPSEIISSEPLQPDKALAPENSINISSSEESSPPIAPSLAPPNVIQSSGDNVNLTSTIQPLDNSSEITSSEQLKLERVLASETSINTSSSRESSLPIAPSIAPPTNIQKSTSQNTVNVNPTSLEIIQPLDKPSEITSSEPLQPDSALASESSIKDSSSRESSPPIAPSITPPTHIQKSTSQDTVNVTPTSLETIQPLYNPSEIASSEPFNPKSSIAEESFLLQPNNQSSQVISRQVSLPLVASEVVAPLSSLPLNPPGQLEPPVNKVESIQSIEINPTSESNTLSTYSSFPKSDLADTASSTSSSPSPKSFPPSNAVKNQIFPLVQSGEARIMRAAKRISSRSPIASETVSRSPGSSEIKTGTIEPQNTSLSQPSNSQKISSADTITPIPFVKGELTSQLLTDTSPNKSMTTVKNAQNFRAQEDKTSNPSQLGITTQSNSVEQGVQPQQMSEIKSERIDSNLSSTSNTLGSLEEKELVNRGQGLGEGRSLMRPRLADLFENARPRLRQTESIPLKIEPRLEITRQELPLSPEQLSELPFPSNSQSSSRQLSQTGGLETANSSPRKIANTNAESTPTINVTIGRVEVRGIKLPEPLPIKKSRAKTPQLSLSDYLKQRGGQ